jgi:hypothetical protein
MAPAAFVYSAVTMPDIEIIIICLTVAAVQAEITPQIATQQQRYKLGRLM